MRSDTPTLINALRILARVIDSPDGVPNAALAEAAERMEELQADVDKVPKTADGVMITPGMVLYYLDPLTNLPQFVLVGDWRDLEKTWDCYAGEVYGDIRLTTLDCYSTEQAAKDAAEKPRNKTIAKSSEK